VGPHLIQQQLRQVLQRARVVALLLQRATEHRLAFLEILHLAEQEVAKVFQRVRVPRVDLHGTSMVVDRNNVVTMTTTMKTTRRPQR
jgi:hypothetical protein